MLKLAVILLVIGMLAMLAFLVAKSISMATGAALRLLFGWEPPRWISLTSITSILALLLFTVFMLRTCEHQQIEMYEDALPAKLELKELIYHDEQSDLREGCGEAIFLLSETTIKKIKSEGLLFFNDATVGRDGDSYHAYAKWRTTPGSDEGNNNRLLRGSSCIEHPPAIWSKIEQAIQAKGSYFTTGSEQDLIVIPELGIVVFSHNG